MSLIIQVLSFLAGILSLQLCSVLPPMLWLCLLPLCLLVIFYCPGLRLTGLFGCGLLWALLHAHWHFLHLLPESMAGEDVWVTGRVADIPVHEGRVQRFVFEVDRFADGAMDFYPMRLRLSWFGGRQSIHAGQSWRLLLRLKPPRGFSNPGGFDYEMALYQQGIHATGYIRDHGDNLKLAAARGPSIAGLREAVLEGLADAGVDNFKGMLNALAVGHRADISRGQWDLLKQTGTNHLMAISGLHIGLVAGIAFWMARRLCPLVLLRYGSAQQFAAIIALSLAFYYALLAGFSIPTQRALVMLMVFMGGIVFNRPLSPGHGLALALAAVLLVDPVAVLSAGFWLSFLAVAVIAFSFSGRLGQDSLLLRWGRLQWVIALGLFPLSLFLFQQASLIAPLANLILVPWVSFLVVPPVLLAVICLPLFPSLAVSVFEMASFSLSLIWPVIEFLGTLPLASWRQPSPSLFNLLLAMTGMILLLSPRGMPLRSLGVFLLLPALLNPPPRPDRGDFWLTLLDVGQGLSLVIRSHDHTLLFDTGARFSPGFDAGERVVLPYLGAEGIAYLDTLLISHGDNDHIGGAESVLRLKPVHQLLGQDIGSLEHPEKQLCQQGQHWQWDGVDFEILHPDREYKERNNRGCVLRVSNNTSVLLIMADVEKSVEQRLLAANGDKLRADVLVVPHHGSRTSSMTGFVKKVSPVYALVSAGYRSRFGHPAAEIVSRYEAVGAKLLNTAEQGAMRFEFTRSNGVKFVESNRKQQHHYWNHPQL